MRLVAYSSLAFSMRANELHCPDRAIHHGRKAVQLDAYAHLILAGIPVYSRRDREIAGLPDGILGRRLPEVCDQRYGTLVNAVVQQVDDRKDGQKAAVKNHREGIGVVDAERQAVGAAGREFFK